MNALHPDLHSSKIADLIEAVDCMDQQHVDDDDRFLVDLHRNCTLDQFLIFLKAALYRAGIAPEFRVGEYDTYMQELATSDTGLGSVPPRLGLIFIHADSFCVWKDAMSLDHETSIERLEGLLAVLATKKFPIAITSLTVPWTTIDSNYAQATGLIDSLNDRIWTFVSQHSSSRLIDVRPISLRLGMDKGFDHRAWYRSKVPFGVEMCKELSFEVSGLVQDLLGRSKKCLILDCDNTIWGGIVGEDGIGGIQLDQHSYPGNVFYEFQRQVLALEKSGVMVALVSKNNEEDVLEVLKNHPDCLLSEENLVGYRINWHEKPGNVQSLVKELNIGLDAVVMIDDSDFECAMMRDALPDVITLQVPKNKWNIPRFLASQRLFSSRPATETDRVRTRMYRETMQRSRSREGALSLDEFFRSLETVAEIRIASADDLPRVSQLLSRTNQFMVTPYRPSEAELLAHHQGDDTFIHTLRSMDRFGDLGIVGTLVTCARQERLEVLAFAMSCRALGRNLEFTFFDHALRHTASIAGFDEVVASYVPSKKNQQVADLFDRLGMQEIGSKHTDPGKRYVGDVSKISVQSSQFIEVKTEW